jgi:UDP-N-acetylglucosamine:LPS N-acetylglucosamine transferase
MPPGREASQHRAHSRSSLPGEATTRGQNWRREPTALGLPAILAPLPVARGVEQTANARVLADAGASVLLPEAELTAEGLVDEVSGLLADPDRKKTVKSLELRERYGPTQAATSLTMCTVAEFRKAARQKR